MMRPATMVVTTADGSDRYPCMADPDTAEAELDMDDFVFPDDAVVTFVFEGPA